jgi:hypothetical protein
MVENGGKKTQKVLEGIQVLIGDNKHLREELEESAQTADDDRRRSDRCFERKRERRDADRERSDERFAPDLELLGGRACRWRWTTSDPGTPA